MTGMRWSAKLWLAAMWAMGLVILAGAGPARAEAVHFKQLTPFVDLKLTGWTMEAKPSGTTMRQGEISMSEARASYRNGDCTTTIQGFKAVENFRTQDHHGEMNISVADRFWVKIEGNGIDNLDVLRAVAQQMNLPKLADLAK